jgi:O-methyltransferase
VTTETETTTEALRDRYLELLKRSLTHSLYGPRSDPLPRPPRNPLKRWLLKRRWKQVPSMPWAGVGDSERKRAEGRDLPTLGQTMVGFERLENFRMSIETAIADRVPGDIIETGVWRGGASIYARGVLETHGVSDRTVWVADSFKGLPPPNPEKHPADAGMNLHLLRRLSVSLEEVKENFRRYDLLDDQVRFLKGWFRDTLPTVREHTWSVIRLDGDLYESTMDGLTNLYRGLSPGGFLIVDDYSSYPACRAAVDDFRRAEGIEEPIQRIDWNGVYWRRSVN